MDQKYGLQRQCSQKANEKLCQKVPLTKIKMQDKLRKATRLLVPLRAEDARVKAQGRHKADRDVLHSMMTLRCFESVKQANNNGRHAGSLVFGAFSVLLTGLSPNKCTLDRTRNNDSPGNGTDNLLVSFPDKCWIRTGARQAGHVWDHVSWNFSRVTAI